MDAISLAREPEIASHEWANRCGYWVNALRENAPKRKRRERQNRPLILAGHGISIRVDKGTLFVRDGNTHFPGRNSEYRFFKGDLKLPSRIILIDGSGAISLDALDWMAAQAVEFIRLNWRGHSTIGATGWGYAADPKKAAWQIETRKNETKRIAFAAPLILAKVKATLFNLEHFLPPSSSRDNAFGNAKAAIETLRSNPPKSVSKLLAVEGTVAQGYFFSWRALAMKWKATGRYPIPDEWRTYFSRSSLKQDMRHGNRHATHPINAMLNYAYSVLESSKRIEALSEGYNPAIGILHQSVETDRHPFVFDLMEPMRPVVDQVILTLIAEETFSGADFVLQRDGVCRLNSELARAIIVASSQIAGQTSFK